MKIYFFKKNFNILIKFEKNVDLLNEKFLENFKLIFSDSNDLKNKLKTGHKLSNDIVMGCALYCKIS